MALLEVVELSVRFGGAARPAVDALSFEVQEGETLAIVGESGCGKSVTSMSILRLLPERGTRTQGGIRFEGRDIRGLSDRELRALRGNEIAMIFQEPMTSLNPVLTIGYQLAETLRLHQGLDRATARQRALDLLAMVHIPAPERRIDEYPHRLSGGMRQRVMIAMALASRPRLLIADEPTTALDVTIQAQILELLRELRRSTGAAVLLITHDLAVVSEVADRVMVMYAGRKVEEGPVGEVMARPLHPYTQGLLAAMPRPGTSLDGSRGQRLAEIPGSVPSPHERVDGCLFAGRCPHVTERCRTEAPALRLAFPQHIVACHHATRQELP